MRKGDDEIMTRISDHAWGYSRGIDDKLKAPLPQHRVEEVEVFDASVHAVLHEHDWKVVNTQLSLIDPLRMDVVFQCSSCKERVWTQADRHDFI